jgi:streptomycin 6-kinase
MTEASVAVPDSLILKGAEIIPAGRQWRANLPHAVANLIEAWSLTIEAPYPGLSYNYVAPVRRADGTPAVLKLWFPDEERGFEREAEALGIYDGASAIRLLRIDHERRAMLLETAEPGYDLWHLQDTNQRIEIAAETMRRLWRSPPAGHSLPPAAAEIQRMVARAPALAKSGFPVHWIADARAMFNELEASAEPVVLHGDLHHANILAAEREPWLAIDPHGLVGPPVWDTIQFIFNVIWPERWEESEPYSLAARRKAIIRQADAFAGALNLDRQAILMCGAARAVLEAFWTLEDHGAGWQPDIEIVEDFASAL